MTLDDWLKKTGTTETAFGARIGLTQASVNRYRRRRIPRAAIIQQIERATEGAVTLADWLPVATTGDAA